MRSGAFTVNERSNGMAGKKRQKKINELFLEAYIGMDKVCCNKFGMSNGGVTEYINKLIKTKLAPGRDEALPRLVKYRNIRNRIAHESGALENLAEIDKQDLKWMENFKKSIERQRDPYTLYLKKIKNQAKRRKNMRGLVIGLIIALVIALAVAIFFIFK